MPLFRDSVLGEHSRVSFLAKNGDCSGESAVTYDQVCALDSPCKAPFLSQKSFREQVVPENKRSAVSLENLLKTTKAIPQCLESLKIQNKPKS